jgi:hypothetical protein
MATHMLAPPLARGFSHLHIQNRDTREAESLRLRTATFSPHSLNPNDHITQRINHPLPLHLSLSPLTLHLLQFLHQSRHPSLLIPLTVPNTRHAIDQNLSLLLLQDQTTSHLAHRRLEDFWLIRNVCWSTVCFLVFFFLVVRFLVFDLGCAIHCYGIARGRTVAVGVRLCGIWCWRGWLGLTWLARDVAVWVLLLYVIQTGVHLRQELGIVSGRSWKVVPRKKSDLHRQAYPGAV